MVTKQMFGDIKRLARHSRSSVHKLAEEANNLKYGAKVKEFTRLVFDGVIDAANEGKFEIPFYVEDFGDDRLRREVSSLIIGHLERLGFEILMTVGDNFNFTVQW